MGPLLPVCFSVEPAAQGVLGAGPGLPARRLDRQADHVGEEGVVLDLQHGAASRAASWNRPGFRKSRLHRPERTRRSRVTRTLPGA